MFVEGGGGGKQMINSLPGLFVKMGYGLVSASGQPYGTRPEAPTQITNSTYIATHMLPPIM